MSKEETLSLGGVSSGRHSIVGTLAERLRSMKGQLAIRVIDEMFDNDPFWIERFAARGRRHSEEDIGFHVDYVVQALIARDPGVLERYARWLQSVLTTRGMCSLHLDESYERLDRAIVDTVGSDFCTTYLDAARKALFYDAGTLARAIQDAAPRLIVVAQRAAPTSRLRDLEHHVSYLADAVFLDRPALFESYVTFAKELFGRHREGGAEHAIETFRVLESAIRDDESLLKDAQAAALKIFSSARSR